MTLNDNLSKRHKEILEIITADPSIKIPDLSKRLGVSTTTIRSDLISLSGKGFITRSHGKALPAFHPNITGKQKSMVSEKSRIAQAAADLVHNDDTIMIGGGTTAALVARYLLGKRDIHLISYSTLVFPYVRINPGIQLTLIGGEFRTYTESLVGNYAAEELARFYSRVIFFGADGFSLESGITANLVEDAAMVEIMVKRGGLKILLADSSKYGRQGLVRFLPLTDIDMLICDKGLPAEVYQQLKKEIKITLV